MRPREDATQVTYPLSEPLAFLQELWQLNHAVEALSIVMERSLGITARQRLVVRLLGRYPGLTASALAQMLRLDRGSVSVLVGRLEEKGLLERRRDPRDGRRVLIGLTANGRALNQPCRGTLEMAAERFLESHSSEAVKATREGFRTLAALVDDERSRLES